VWRITDETLLYSFDASSTVNLFLAISPDNKILAIPTPNGIVFYNLLDGSLVNQLSDHPNTIDQAAISPNGDRVAALVSGDGLMVWDLNKGQMAYSLSKVGAIHLDWSPDGKWLALGGWDDSIRFLRAEDGRTMRSIPAHTEQVQSVAFSPDGKLIASSSMRSVKVWQFSSGTLLQKISVSGGWVPSVKFSPDGKYLAATSADGKIEVWQVSNGLRMAELPVPALSGDRDVIDFAPVGDFLAIGEISQILLWRFTESKPFQLLSIGDAQVSTLRISPDGTLLVCGLTDGTIQFWQIPEGKLLRTLNSGTEGIVSLDFSADGQIFLSASRDGTLHVWSISK